MFGQFRDIKEFDTIFFVPHPEDDNQVKVEVAQYKEPSEKVPGSVMGDMFDIILFRMCDDTVIDLDRFDGILSDPKTYVSRMIKEDWYGLVTRKTVDSNTLTDKIFAEWSNMCYNNG